jgi:membrane-associated phospholipid phosphatase
VRLHHASDVVAGTALGLAFGVAARRFAPPPPEPPAPADPIAPGNAG